MPDFGASFTGGTTLERWADPALDQRPSRINPDPLHPHRYRRSEVGEEIEVTASVGGVAGPLDAALGGRLFLGWFAECPTGNGPAVTIPPGQSSVRRFTVAAGGHYTYVLRRQGGGGIILHVDVVGLDG
jgi:hypothetical protein